MNLLVFIPKFHLEGDREEEEEKGGKNNVMQHNCSHPPDGEREAEES